MAVTKRPPPALITDISFSVTDSKAAAQRDPSSWRSIDRTRAQCAGTASITINRIIAIDRLLVVSTARDVFSSVANALLSFREPATTLARW